jgi:hypothetical protein
MVCGRVCMGGGCLVGHVCCVCRGGGVDVGVGGGVRGLSRMGVCRYD